MNEKQTDDLDALLRQWECPAPPPWLATRALAEIRNTSEPGTSKGYRILRWALLPALSFLFLAGMAWLWMTYSYQAVEMDPSSMASLESLESALDVFARYSEDAEPWSGGEVF